VPVRLERDDAPARPDDSGDLANDGRRVGYVLERALDPRGVEFVVSEREPVGVGLDEADRGSAPVARLRGREELAAEVDPDDASGRPDRSDSRRTSSPCPQPTSIARSPPRSWRASIEACLRASRTAETASR
jgi:hypothetical protein